MNVTRFSELQTLIADAKGQIYSLESALTIAREQLRSIERTKEDEAPAECEVCRRGIWPTEAPHVHCRGFGRRTEQKYTAKVVERKAAEKPCTAEAIR